MSSPDVHVYPPSLDFAVMVQGREALYTHEHGYDSDRLSPLQQRKHHSQRDDLQLQAALLVQGLRQKFSRGSPTPNGYTDEKREEILRAYQKRSSLRGLSRTFGVSRNTVTSWLEKSLRSSQS